MLSGQGRKLHTNPYYLDQREDIGSPVLLPPAFDHEGDVEAEEEGERETGVHLAAPAHQLLKLGLDHSEVQQAAAR